jgi:hypothetical protein
MSSSQTAFENALDDLFKALVDIAKKHMLSPISVDLLLHIVAHAADHTMMGEIGSKGTESRSEDQNERSGNN